MLDTSAYSHFRAGEPQVIDLMASAAVIIVPATVLGELTAAFVQGRRAADNHHLLAQFLEEPFVLTLDTDRRIAERYGEVFAALRRAGTPIPINDVWIAAACIEADGQLLTFDRDFERVEGLDVVSLKPS